MKDRRSDSEQQVGVGRQNRQQSQGNRKITDSH